MNTANPFLDYEINFDALPSDPEEAFLLLEPQFRAECERKVSEARGKEDEDVRVYYLDYLAKVLATIEALELDTQFTGPLPIVQDMDFFTYQNFAKQITHYVTKLQVRRARRSNSFSVRFDAATKAKLRHHLDQVREIFDRLEIEDGKKEALFNCVNALQAEIDRDRTRLEAYGDLTLAVSGILGRSIKKLAPIHEILDRIGFIIWGVRHEQQMPQIEGPKRRAQIEGPKTPPDEGQVVEDEEIPF